MSDIPNKHIVITRRCIGIAEDEDGYVISKFLFMPGDLLELSSTYHYYVEENHHWNTEHPKTRPKLGFSWSGFEYKIPPDTYVYRTLLSTQRITTFTSSDKFTALPDRLLLYPTTDQIAVDLLLDIYTEERMNKLQNESKIENRED